MNLMKSEKGVTPVIAIILLLMMTVAAAGAAYLWITKISTTMTTGAEKNISETIRRGNIKIIAHYACEGSAAGDSVINSTESPTQPVRKEGYLCFLVKNDPSAVLRLADLSSTVVTYELPGAPNMGTKPILMTDIGVELTDKSGKKVYCTFADISDGRCDEKRSINPGDTFEITFTGKFKDESGTKVDFTYENAKENRIIIHLNLPTGFKVSQQVTD